MQVWSETLQCNGGASWGRTWAVAPPAKNDFLYYRVIFTAHKAHLSLSVLTWERECVKTSKRSLLILRLSVSLVTGDLAATVGVTGERWRELTAVVCRRLDLLVLAACQRPVSSSATGLPDRTSSSPTSRGASGARIHPAPGQN